MTCADRRAFIIIYYTTLTQLYMLFLLSAHWAAHTHSLAYTSMHTQTHTLSHTHTPTHTHTHTHTYTCMHTQTHTHTHTHIHNHTHTNTHTNTCMHTQTHTHTYRSEKPTSKLQSTLKISHAVFCFKKKHNKNKHYSQQLTHTNLTSNQTY